MPKRNRKSRKRRRTRNNRTRNNRTRNNRTRRRTRRSRGGKRKMNAYFKLMIDAKRKKLKSFRYKNKTYVGKKHKHLGMIYRKK